MSFEHGVEAHVLNPSAMLAGRVFYLKIVVPEGN